jgi:DNA relaxase NicK
MWFADRHVHWLGRDSDRAFSGKLVHSKQNLQKRVAAVSQTHGFDPNEVFAHYKPNHVPGDPRTSSYSQCDSQE